MNTDFITKPTQSFYARVTNNKHTSAAAVVVIGGEFVSALTKIWAPQYQLQMDETLKVIQRAAMAYGLLMAGDSSPTVNKQP